MDVAQNMMNVIQDQLKNNPQELKKMKRKMKKWSKTPEGLKKIEKMKQAMGTMQQPSTEEQEELEPKDILRARLRAMKDKRVGKKL